MVKPMISGRSCTLIFSFLFIFSIHLIPVQAQAQQSRFGFLGPDSPERNPAYYQEFVKLGVDFDRPHIGPFVWENVEPEPGTYNWDQIDMWVTSSQEHDVHILATIWPFANWDQQYWRDQQGWEISEGFEKELPDSRYKPHDTTAYKAWISAMVERYDGDGTDDMPGLTLPVEHWEILNEPESYDWDGLSFFKGDEQDFLEVLRITATTIRSADPDAIILHGGSTGTRYDYWQRVMEMGATEYFDISNTHSITPPENVTDLRAEAWNNLLSPFGVQSFWITEVELAKHGSESYSEEEQADVLVKQYVNAFAKGADIIFHAHLMIPEENDSEFSEAALILLRFDDGEDQPPTFIYKPNYFAFKTMMMIDEFVSVQQLGEREFAFNMPDGSTIWVVWGSEAEINYLPDEFLITELDGSQMERSSSEFSPSARPVFIQSASSTHNEGFQTQVPNRFSISNFPNPFNPSTTVQVETSESGFLSLSLYDITGRHIRSIASESVSNGKYSYQLDAQQLSSGMYIIVGKLNDQQFVRSISLLK